MASGIDTVIFDMDGVIFDSEILVLQAWKEVAERHGIAGVEAACHECLGTNSVVSKGVFLKHYGEDFPYEEYKAEMAKVFFSHASGGKLAKKPGVEELLKYLKAKGFKIGLASSTREALVRSEISDGGLLGYFDQIIGGDMVERSKPEPDIFLEACRREPTPFPRVVICFHFSIFEPLETTSNTLSRNINMLCQAFWHLDLFVGLNRTDRQYP